MNSEGTSRVQCYWVNAIRACACETFLLLSYRAARIIFMQPLLANISIRARDKARFSFLELRMAQVLFHAGQRDGVPAPSPVFAVENSKQGSADSPRQGKANDPIRLNLAGFEGRQMSPSWLARKEPLGSFSLLSVCSLRAWSQNSGTRWILMDALPLCGRYGCLLRNVRC